MKRARIIGASCAVVIATMLMWSDAAIIWWGNIVDALLRVNKQATLTVMDSRPTGDADLHAVIWGVCALLVAIACTSQHLKLVGLAALAVWTLFVEIAQPWFTDQRTRQASDLVGNILGIGIVVGVTRIMRNRRARQFIE